MLRDWAVTRGSWTPTVVILHNPTRTTSEMSPLKG